VVLVVTGLDGDFSLRRIERYLVLARSGGARAAVVLSKADLVEDPEEVVRRASKTAAGMAVLAVSAVTGTGLDALAEEIGPGRTAVLVGSSGAGKSTLINRLLGEERQRTGAVRQHDDRGRHVTARRELLVLPCGGLVIDTPGLREVGMVGDEDAVLSVFPKIAELARGCRFGDCAHRQEPGCAVQEAARTGELDPDRLESFHRLVREQSSAARRASEHERRAHERATYGKYRRQLRDVYRLKGRDDKGGDGS
jgi:ribosome biogenesis GTPase